MFSDSTASLLPSLLFMGVRKTFAAYNIFGTAIPLYSRLAYFGGMPAVGLDSLQHRSTHAVPLVSV